MIARIKRNYVPAYCDDFFNDRVFSNFHHPARPENWPAVNVSEEDKAYRIDMAAPGLTPEDFRIQVEDHVLHISSEQKEDKEKIENNYLRKEFTAPSFTRSFQLPESLDQDQITASHEHGILRIHLPKKEEEIQNAPRRIEVN